MASLLAIVGSIAFILVVFVLPVWEFYRVRGLEQDSNAAPTSGSARLKLIGIVVAIVAVSLGYKLIVLGHLEQTSALFIGLPGVLATLVVVLAKPKTVTGMLCMVTAIALLISGIFLSEGFMFLDKHGRRFANAAPTALPIRSAPAAARPARTEFMPM